MHPLWKKKPTIYVKNPGRFPQGKVGDKEITDNSNQSKTLVPLEYLVVFQKNHQPQ